MRRRDLLTYDVETSRRPGVAWPSVALLAAVIVMAGLLVGWVATSGSDGSNRTADAAPATTAPASSEPEPSVPSAPASSASQAGTGTDAEQAAAVPDGSVQAARTFVTAWLDTNPTSRKKLLAQIASPALTDELMLTDTANIPRVKASGLPVLDEASTYSVQFVQALTGGSRIRVYLVADPQSRYRWLVTSVERA